MDAVKFIEERNRMCDYYRYDNEFSGCAECPAFQMTCVSVRSVTAEYITAVEQWSKEHPRKTRQSVLLEQYPEADLDTHGLVQLCPLAISAAHRDGSGLCADPDRFIEWNIVEGFVWQSLSGINAGEIGKTVFLTREEAEKALEAMKDE